MARGYGPPAEYNSALRSWEQRQPRDCAMPRALRGKLAPNNFHFAGRPSPKNLALQGLCYFCQFSGLGPFDAFDAGQRDMAGEVFLRLLTREFLNCLRYRPLQAN